MIHIDNYDPFKTAIKRNYLSRPMKELLKRDLLKGDILNYGCGFAEDNTYLWQEHHIQSWAYDKYNQDFKDDFLLKEEYDTVTCFYVLNVIPDLNEHEEVIELLRSIGKNVYIAVRSDIKAIRPTWKYDEKALGYWTTSNTFQRFYDKEMIEKLIENVEYIVSNSEMKLFKLV